MSEKFELKYSAPTINERKEIEHIRAQYTQKSDDKLTRLRKLDGKVKNIPTMLSLILGIIGIMIFGLGMTFAIEWNNIILGIILGVIGCVPMLLATPVYNISYKKLKNKYSDEIISLSNELLNDKEAQ